jgi:hypothetical protein
MYSSNKETESQMATRATYQFKNQWSGTHTVYIHHDGYPEGAAAYLNNDKLGPIHNVNTFLRNNLKAELTESHESHGDTQFRYTMEGSHILVEERIGFTDKWDINFEGSINHFINQWT